MTWGGGMSMTPTVVAGRYRLVRQLGVGGMGQVWLAHDERLDRDVAVKQVVLPPGLSDDTAAETRSRAVREARTAARLNHPNVVQIYDVLEDEERPWIVMEFVDGRSLHDAVNQDGPLPSVQVAHIGLAVLDALVVAHAAGILHRDVKPGNVLLGRDGRVVLTDFGLATLEGGEGVLTLPGLVYGSVRFIAPERARDGTATAETDLWALGATLYAAVEGQPPYARATAMETLTALATAMPDPPRRAGPLKPVLRGLLRRNPRHRLGAEEARRLLQQAAGANGTRVRHRLVPRQSSRAPAGPVRPPPGSAPPTDRSHRRRLRVALAALGLAAVTALGTGLAINGYPRHRAPAAPVAPAVHSPTPEPRLLLGDEMCPTDTPTPLRAASREPDWDALVAGWVWYRDPGGYRVAVPDGWSAYLGGAGRCFRDVTATRWLGVTAWTPGGQPLDHLAAREQEMLRTDPPSGYQKLHMGSVPYFGDGAEWEFGYDDQAHGRMHGLVRDFVVAPGHGYTIAWCTTEFDWTVNLDNLRLVEASFTPPE